MKTQLSLFALCLLGTHGFSSGLDTVYVGRVDTVGLTTADIQQVGPVFRYLANAPDYGLHVQWVHSTDTSVNQPRGLTYSFRSNATGSWRTTNSVWPGWVGCGCLGVDPTTGVAVITAYYGGYVLKVAVARDIGPGAGLFESFDGPEDYLYPALAVGQSGAIHVSMLEYPDFESLYYARVNEWPMWEPSSGCGRPASAAYNIAASRASQRVCIVWTAASLGVPFPVYWLESTDGGTSWGQPAQLPSPSAFGPDTVTTFGLNGVFPYYDQSDRLHIAMNVLPVYEGSVLPVPAGIWHWGRDNAPEWTEVQRAGCAPEHLMGYIGDIAEYVDRVSLGEDSRGHLFAAWEQFDSMNVEPQTGLLRAGVWVAGSNDNGASWTPPMRLTPENSVSHRFPCIADRMVGGGVGADTIAVAYLADEIAGFSLYSQGRATFNPITCQLVAADVVGLDEPSGPSSGRTRFHLWPNPASRVVYLAGSMPVMVSDAAGRMVVQLRPGANDIRDLSTGVYFVMLASGGPARKIIIQH